VRSATTAAAPCEAGAQRFVTLPPLSIYVHLPWCVRKCPYCDFNSYEIKGAPPDGAYVDALLRDLHADWPLAQGRAPQTIFLGGGTPSLFSAAAIERLLDGLRSCCALPDDVEITLEANPGAVDAERFAAFRAAGVTRLSIGIQSFRNAQLHALGRVHDAAEAIRAVAVAREAGFDNLNLDLMYGLPGDDLAGALTDLEQAIELAPTHLSWYQLTLEPNTAFQRRPPALPGDELVAELEPRGRALLAAAGYARYEISAYARPDRQCAHNLNYWRFGDYLGIGAGAHGKVTMLGEQRIERRAKTRNPRTYAEQAGAPAAVTVETIATPQQATLEFLLNALRLLDGVSDECFATRVGQPVEGIATARREAERRGWLAAEPRRLRATPAGLEVLNRLLALFA